MTNLPLPETSSSADFAYQHQPVMLAEVLAYAGLQPGQTLVDGTLGLGGHSLALLKALSQPATLPTTLLGIDRDPLALNEAQKRLQADLTSEVKLRFKQGSYAQLSQFLQEEGLFPLNGVLLVDLGVSSYQLDAAERGFSFSKLGPLDMRMDPDLPNTAADLLATASESQLADWLHYYGEERLARPIAKALVNERETTPWLETTALAQRIERIYHRYNSAGKQKNRPQNRDKKAVHPATRTFQALRIAVNKELEQLEQLLSQLPAALAPGSRVVFLTFHSLEDRLVKQALTHYIKGCVCPPQFPACVCGQSASFKALTLKPLTPSPAEIEQNPRARSTKLRSYQRL